MRRSTTGEGLERVGEHRPANPLDRPAGGVGLEALEGGAERGGGGGVEPVDLVEAEERQHDVGLALEHVLQGLVAGEAPRGLDDDVGEGVLEAVSARSMQVTREAK